MKKYIISLLVCTILASVGCAPVRSGKYSKKSQKSVMAKHDDESKSGEQTSSEKHGAESADGAKASHSETQSDPQEDQSSWNPYKTQKGRFSDTAVIYLPPVNIGYEGTIGTAVESTIEEFNKEYYESACETFQNLSNTIIKGDSLQFECIFYGSECEIMKESYSTAANMLKGMLDNPNLPRSILERSLVRLGQLYCVENKPREAKKLFDRLKEEFPGSMYIPLANCDAVQYK